MDDIEGLAWIEDGQEPMWTHETNTSRGSNVVHAASPVIYESDSVYESSSEISVDVRELIDQSVSAQGVRQVALLRQATRHSFGFTLRHFIWYPCDQDAAQSVVSACRAMETVFVRSVRTGSAAYLAGLHRGDRVVCVNGYSVLGVSYVNIVRLIQHCHLRLVLNVVPAHDDLLQRLFGRTAHDPHSNLTMKPSMSHLPRPQPYRSLDDAAGDGTAASSSTSSLAHSFSTGHKSHDMQAASSRVSIGNGVSAAAGSQRRLSVLSLQLPVSTSSLPPPAHSGPIDVNDPIYSRIRRTVDEKEQFLKRPNQPLWLPSPLPASTSASTTSSSTPATSTGQVCMPLLREYHVNPGRLAPAQWPPASSCETPAVSDCSLKASSSLRTRRSARHHSSEMTTSSESLSSSGAATATSAATVTAASPGSEDSPEYVQYDALTQVPRVKTPRRTHLVQRRTRQFETGRPNNDVYQPPVGGSCGSELQLLNKAAKNQPAVGVRSRRSEFEQRDSDNESSSAEIEAAYRRNLLRSGSRLVIVGGPRLHAEPIFDPVRDVESEESSPPPPPLENSLDTVKTSTSMRPLTVVSESGSDAANSLQRKSETHKMQTVNKTQKTPAKERRARNETRKSQQLNNSSVSTTESGVQPVTPLLVKNAVVSRAVAVQHARANKPATSQPSQPVISTNVVLRAKQKFGDAESDKCVRRVSYLKATSSDHPPPLDPDTGSTTSVRTKSFPPAKLATTSATTKAATREASREGWLHVKMALVDGRRPGNRSWRPLWAVLRGDTLNFYRDRKEASVCPELPDERVIAGSVNASSPHHNHNAQSPPAPGAVCVSQCTITEGGAAEEHTRRKHVVGLHCSVSDSHYLLHTSELLEREAWLSSLRPLCLRSSEKLSPGAQTEGSMLSPISERAIKTLSALRQKSPSTLPAAIKLPKTNTSPDQLGSPKSKTWRDRMTRQLKKIHVATSTSSATLNPSTSSLLPDGSTLGVPLELCPPSAGNAFVPLLVKMCTDIVEHRGLDCVGIYRVPGNSAAITSLSDALNTHGVTLDLSLDPRWTDVNVISSLLKSFFRRLPDSLVTCDLYQHFIDASKIEDPERRKLQLRKLVNDLPDHNYETLKHLLRHLRRVTSRSSNNRMEPKNLAIVFGPTLVRCVEDSAAVAMVTDMSQQCRIVETLISEYERFFPSEDAGTSDVSCCVSSTTSPPSCTASTVMMYPSPPSSSVTATSTAVTGSCVCVSGDRSSSCSTCPLHHNIVENHTTHPPLTSPPSTPTATGITSPSLQQLQLGRTCSSPPSTSPCSPLNTIQRVDPVGGVTARQVVSSILTAASRRKSSLDAAAVMSTNASLNNTVAGLHRDAASSACSTSPTRAARSFWCAAATPPTDTPPMTAPPPPRRRFSDHLLSSVMSQGRDVTSGCVSDKAASRSVESVLDSGGGGAYIPNYKSAVHRDDESTRRFEAETRSILQREIRCGDAPCQRRALQRARIEREWASAKRDMEHDDFLDELADHPTSGGFRAAESPLIDSSFVIQRKCSVESPSSGYSTQSSSAPTVAYPIRSPGATYGASCGKNDAEAVEYRQHPLGAVVGSRVPGLVSSRRFYRSPRLIRRGRSADCVGFAADASILSSAAAKVTQKRDELARKWRTAINKTQHVADRHWRPLSMPQEVAVVSPGAVAAAGHVVTGSKSDGNKTRHDDQQHEDCDSALDGSSDSADMLAFLTRTLDRKLRHISSTPSSSASCSAVVAEKDAEKPSSDASVGCSPQQQGQILSGNSSGTKVSLHSPSSRHLNETGRCLTRDKCDWTLLSDWQRRNSQDSADCSTASTAATSKKGMKRTIRELCERFEPSCDEGGGVTVQHGGRTSCGGGAQLLTRRGIEADTKTTQLHATSSAAKLQRRHTVGGERDFQRLQSILPQVLPSTRTPEQLEGRQRLSLASGPGSHLLHSDAFQPRQQPPALESRV